MNWFALALLCLSACDDSDSPPVREAVRDTGWSVGAPKANPVAGNSFEIPTTGSINYITRRASLAGKSRITLRYRVDMGEGVTIVPKCCPALPSQITLYFQRSGDNWSGAGKFETYRWFATFATQMPITAGEHEMVAPLDANWTAIMTSSRETNPQGFADAVANAERVGFTLGGGDGYGHGVRATGPARLTITYFGVE